MKIVAVIGSRSFNNYEYLRTSLKNLLNLDKNSYTIVSGGANGADKLSEKFAKEFNLNTIIHLPDWDKHGKSAGFVRNKLIIKDADIVVAFWDGESKGTGNSLSIAKKLKKETHIYYY